MNETEEFLYPSVTFCRKLKWGTNLVVYLREEADEAGGLDDINQLNLTENIEKMRYEELK